MDKLEKLKNNLKKLKKEKDALEEEFFELNCDRCQEIEYKLYSIMDKEDDIRKEISNLKKKAKNGKNRT